jgi:RNA polymerase sigma factor (sigma-70 family)
VTEYHYETPFDQANDIAQALLTTRVFAKMHSLTAQDMDDERQELSLHLLTAIKGYDPSKGAVSTWTYSVFRHWLWERVQHRLEREQEIPWDPFPNDDRHEWLIPLEHVGEWLYDTEEQPELSLEGHELLERFPERVRPTLQLVWADGLTAGQTAEHLGITARTVERHKRAARDVIGSWGEAA